MALRIVTEREELVLLQLATRTDDLAYFAAVGANRDHLSQFGDETASKYPTLESVRDARLRPSNPDKLRFGIWNTDDFVGSINLTPEDNGGAEIGYWLDKRHTGHGYATLAVKAIAKYGALRFSPIQARVAEGNESSSAVLERAGFQLLAREIGSTVFSMSNPKRPANVRKLGNEIIPLDMESLAELPSSRNALRAKDKNNLTVFLKLGTAQKLYRCPCCHGNIDIGSSHVIMSRVQMSKRHTHHHLDFACVQEMILPTLSSIQVVKPEEASASAVNARGRKYRNKKRRKHG